MHRQAPVKFIGLAIILLAVGFLLCGSVAAQEPVPSEPPAPGAEAAVPPAAEPAEHPADAHPAEGEAHVGETHEAAAEGAHGEHAAEASHGEHAGFPTGQVIAAVVNFIIFVVILVWVSKGAVRSYYKKRSEELTDAIRKAEDTLKAAKAMEQEALARLDKASQDAEKITENAKEIAGRLSTEILETARKQSERILADAQSTAQAEAKKISDDLIVELSAKVVEIARNNLKDKTDQSAQRGLVGDYLNKVGEV